MNPQLGNHLDRFKAFMRQSAQRQLDALARDESVPPGMTRRADLGANAVSDIQYRGSQQPQATISDFAKPEAPKEPGFVSTEAREALKQVREQKPDYQGTDQKFYDLYQKYGKRLLSELPTPTPTLGNDLIKGTPQQYAGLIAKAAQDNGVPARLLSALIKQESGFNPNAKSPAGALGIAQFMPATAKGFGINPLDPTQAIPAAALYLKRSFDKFGSWDLALAAYNAGGGAVGKYGGIPPYPETQNYVKNIMAMAGGGN